MAQQNVKSTEQQDQQSQTQQGSLARAGRDTLSFYIAPGDLLRTSPFSLMRRMMEDMLLGDVALSRGTTAAVWSPAIELGEQNGNFVIRAELPGLTPNDVKVEVADDALAIQGERKFEQQEAQGGVQRTERQYGRFYRRIPLPDRANVQEARAKFENGVLEITVPLSQESRPREIPIEASEKAEAGGKGQAGPTERAA